MFEFIISMPTDNKIPFQDCKYAPHIQKYVSSFDDIDKMCFEIAKSHLKSSFNIEKSVGYKKFIAKK
tara:strand:+ start:1633 stop:1833 length:201 start_codon:yes stop_codon:yes gene_type:complete